MFVIMDLPVPFGVTVMSPFVSVEVIALPSSLRLSTNHSLIFLFESTSTAVLAVRVPCA